MRTWKIPEFRSVIWETIRCLRNEPKTERCSDLRERPKSNLQNLKTYIRLYPHSLEKLSTAEQESYNTHSDKRSRFKIKLNIIFIATLIIISRCIVIITIVFIFISIIIKNVFFIRCIDRGPKLCPWRRTRQVIRNETRLKETKHEYSVNLFCSECSASLTEG